MSNAGGDAAVKVWQPPAVDGPLSDGGASAPVRRLPTAGELEALQQQAYREGFDSGRRDGYEAGSAAAESDYRARLDLLGGLFDTLSRPLEELDQEVVDATAELAVLIARHLVRRELKTAPGEIVAVVRAAIGTLPVAQRNPRIRLNPEDLALIEEVMGGRDDKLDWRLEGDPLISRGGCLVETDTSFVDATVEARLAAIVSQMLGGGRETD